MPKQKLSLYEEAQLIVDVDRQAEIEDRSRNNMWEVIAKTYLKQVKNNNNNAEKAA